MALALVTGGAGFIGAHLVRGLLDQGHRVRVLDNFSSGRPANLEFVLKRKLRDLSPGQRLEVDSVEILHGDICDLEACKQACEDVQTVYHQAAMRSVPRSVDDPRGANENNVNGTLNILIAAAGAKARRVVSASSSSVYGDDPSLPKREDQMPAPISPYAASKLAGEHYCRVFARTYGLSTVSLRYFNVFGPLQDPASQYAAVIPRFIMWTLQGQPLEIHGDGLQSRDFTYIDNVVSANLLAATAPNLQGEAFNIACGERLTLMDLVSTIERITGQRAERNHVEPRRGDVRHTLADISRAGVSLGYKPIVSFAEGMERTVAYFVPGVAGRSPGSR
jgi:nucleoside-diphosphate-sugar epimerase